jgi:transcriptional antiterminator NusG
VTPGLVPGRIPARRLLKGDDMDEHREAEPFPRKGQEVRVVDGPFAGFIGTVVDVDEFLRHVQIVVLFFGQETSLRLNVLQLEAAP